VKTMTPLSGRGSTPERRRQSYEEPRRDETAPGADEADRTADAYPRYVHRGSVCLHVPSEVTSGGSPREIRPLHECPQVSDSSLNYATMDIYR